MNTKTSKLTLALITAAATLFATGIVAKAESYTVKAGDTLSSIAEEKSKLEIPSQPALSLS